MFPRSTFFSLDAYRRLVKQLVDTLIAQKKQALDRPIASLEVSIYKDHKELPFSEISPSTASFASVFPALDVLFEKMREADPAAVEAGLSILSIVSPEEAADLGGKFIQLKPWPELERKAVMALSLSAREESFVQLLEAVCAGAYGSFYLRKTPFKGGGRLAFQKLMDSSIWRYEPIKIPTESEWRLMSDTEKAAIEKNIENKSGDFSHQIVSPVEYILGFLGEKRIDEARSAIIKLYKEHPSRHIRLAAGHALISYGDEDSLSLLQSLIEQHDEWRRWFGVKAAILEDPATAVERLGGKALLEESYRERVIDALEILESDAQEKSQQSGRENIWVFSDKHWANVLTHWSKERQPPGPAAADLLSLFHEGSGLGESSAKEKYSLIKEPPPQTLKGKKIHVGALETFKAGNGEEAWKRLMDLKDAVRNPAYIEEAQEVARLTMIRARENLEIITERLSKLGYHFLYPKHIFVPPAVDVRKKVDELESIVGILPLALRAAFEHLGAWLLNGDHPSWAKTSNVELRPAASEKDVLFTDPFMMAPIGPILQDIEGWGGRGVFSVDFSGDRLLKAGYSGSSYSIIVPNLAADAAIEGESHGYTFVEHLRTCLRYGGFAGFKDMPDRPQEFIDALIVDLPSI